MAMDCVVQGSMSARWRQAVSEEGWIPNLNTLRGPEAKSEHIPSSGDMNNVAGRWCSHRGGWKDDFPAAHESIVASGKILAGGGSGGVGLCNGCTWWCGCFDLLWQMGNTNTIKAKYWLISVWSQAYS